MSTVEFLAEWMIRSAFLIAGGTLLLWVLRLKDSSIRTAAWTAMLCGSMVIPALNSAFPKTLLPNFRKTAAGVVVRPRQAPVVVSAQTPAPVSTLTPVDPMPRKTARTAMLAPPAAGLAAPAATYPFALVRAGLMFYAAICGAMLLRICAGLLVGWRLLRRSHATGRVTGGIEIRESSDLSAPLTLGVLRPAIALPADWREWNSAKLEAVLAHEQSHIQRRDPWVQLLSGIHRAILWGSPLSWFLHLRIVQSAEEASDDAAVAAIQDRVSYAETLLGFMQCGVWNSGFVGVSMARYGSPEKRIRRILNSSALSRGITGRGVAAIVALGSPLAYVIATAQARPQFDVADVHGIAISTGANLNMRGGVMRAGIYQLQGATMVDLIKTAYGVDADKVLGGPSWLELDRYDVYAKGPAGTSTETANLMLQSLLGDRFKLALHRDSRAFREFALTVPKGGSPKLKKADGSGNTGCKMTPQVTDAEFVARRQAFAQSGQNPYIVQTYLYACQNMTMAAFAAAVRNMVSVQQYFDTDYILAQPGQPLPAGKAVVDRTGLIGAWDFDFKYSQKPAATAAVQGIDGEVISIFDAMEKQLGLKLEAAKIPTPVIVVDSVNRKPSDNPPEVKAILPPPPPAAFEVADLRLSDPNAPEVRSPGPQPGGRFEVRNFPLNFLITIGWELPSNGTLRGAPAWLGSARVDLTAKLPSTDVTHQVVGVVDLATFQPALKTLLTERFKIAIHTEQQPVPGYALVAVKPKLQKADPAERTKCKEGPGADGKDPRVSNPLLSRLMTCQNMTMREFAEQQLVWLVAPPPTDRTEVVDATGIEGAYDFTLSFTPSNLATAVASQPAGAQASDPGGVVTLFDALEKQLGLKLEKRNIPSPVVILDHIDEKPADN